MLIGSTINNFFLSRFRNACYFDWKASKFYSRKRVNKAVNIFLDFQIRKAVKYFWVFGIKRYLIIQENLIKFPI